MKKILLMLALIVFVGCEKETPTEPAQPDPTPEAVNWAEWSIPANLPTNFEEELFATPCWYAPGSERAAKIENGKVVIKDRWDLYYGGGNVVFVFDEQGWDSYGLSTMPSSTPLKPYHHRADLELSRDYFVAYYPDSLLVFSPDKISKFKEGDNLCLYFMQAQTEEFYDENIGVWEEN